ncbi:MAG: cardiolipin synthase [Planctomycetes bacterium]|nr:cardiolipin synthase [Planctomycetota bacterium]MCB9905763.1 cardiolipin synthase [Planctomycetota bacterium]
MNVADWLPELLFTSHWLIVIGLSLRVIHLRRPVGVTLAWFLILLALPFVGAGFYLMLGENRFSERYTKLAGEVHAQYAEFQARLRERVDQDRVTITDAARSLKRHATRVVGFPAIPDNDVVLLGEWQLFFEHLIEDVRAARSSVHLEFYILSTGGLVDDLLLELEAARARGVSVRILLDAVGSGPFLSRNANLQRLRSAGIELGISHPVGFLRALLSRIDLRNHRKNAVIDGEVAYTGSQNLVDPRFFKQESGVGQWIDAMARLRGPVVEAMGAAFAEDWQIATGKGLIDVASTHDIKPQPPAGTYDVQVIPSGPAFEPKAMQELLLTALYAARESVVLTTPYFVPDDSLEMAIQSAALRGVDVTIIVPRKNDSTLVHFASRSHFEDLMEAGAKIAAYDGGLLHTKSIVIDNDFAVFGTVNLDMRSMWLNFELSLFVYDERFACELRVLQESYLDHCEFFDLARWRARPMFERLRENVVRLVGPLL